MRRLAEDDVQTRCYRVQMSDVVRPGLAQRSVSQIDELTSRVSNKEIPRKLDRLEVPYKANWERGEIRSLDVVLATNMLSVGVDVNRLGLMVVNGQPKTTAEYIQATSRVGRAFPGLVCTVLTWARPRDLSHYETFEHYHATFYRYVEALSVTPFSSRALDRGLTATLVSLVRHGADPAWNPNSGAQVVDLSDARVRELVDVIVARAADVASDTAIQDEVRRLLEFRVDRWRAAQGTLGVQLGYKEDTGTVKGLLHEPTLGTWDEFSCPNSLRETEPTVNLIIGDCQHDPSLVDAPPFILGAGQARSRTATAEDDEATESTPQEAAR